MYLFKKSTLVSPAYLAKAISIINGNACSNMGFCSFNSIRTTLNMTHHFNIYLTMFGILDIREMKAHTREILNRCNEFRQSQPNGCAATSPVVCVCQRMTCRATIHMYVKRGEKQLNDIGLDVCVYLLMMYCVRIFRIAFNLYIAETI